PVGTVSPTRETDRPLPRAPRGPGGNGRRSGAGGADVLADEGDDVAGRGAGREDLAHPQRLEACDVLRRDDAAPEDDDVLDALRAQEREHLAEQVVVRPGEDGEADGVDVLLDRRRDDLLVALVEARVDDLHPGVAQRPGDDLGSAIMDVEP